MTRAKSLRSLNENCQNPFAVGRDIHLDTPMLSYW
jgi:hypothetical protein